MYETFTKCNVLTNRRNVSFETEDDQNCVVCSPEYAIVHDSSSKNVHLIRSVKSLKSANEGITKLTAKGLTKIESYCIRSVLEYA